jgi:DNA-binding response OmpR family regulator
MLDLARAVLSRSAADRDTSGARSHANALAALRAASRGERHQAAVLIADVERSAQGREHAVERVLVHVARATLLAMDGEAARAHGELTLALQAAARAAIDTDLVIELVHGLGDVVLVTGAARQLASSSAIAWPANTVVLDARSHELRIRGDVRSLERRPVVRRLLYALSRHPARLLDKEVLVEAVWGCSYDPLRHDDALKANVHHLRRLVAGSGVTIACGNPGYRLDPVERFLFVAPFDLFHPVLPADAGHRHGGHER